MQKWEVKSQGLRKLRTKLCIDTPVQEFQKKKNKPEKTGLWQCGTKLQGCPGPKGSTAGLSFA